MYVFSAARRQFQRAKKRKPDLSPVRMTADHQADRFARRMHQQVVSVIGLMAHQKEGLTFDLSYRCRYRLIQIGPPAQCIIKTRQPDAVAVPLDRQVRIDEDRDAAGSQRTGDFRSAQKMIVIPQDRVQLRTLQFPQHLRALPRGSLREPSWADLAGDKISREKYRIRL